MIFVLSVGCSLKIFANKLFRVLKPNCLPERHEENIFFKQRKRERERERDERHGFSQRREGDKDDE
jgi:hypothetical protein